MFYLILDKMFPWFAMHHIRQAERSLHGISDNIMTQGFGNTAEWAVLGLRSGIESTEMADIVKTGRHQYRDQFQIYTDGAGVSVKPGLIDLFYHPITFSSHPQTFTQTIS